MTNPIKSADRGIELRTRRKLRKFVGKAAQEGRDRKWRKSEKWWHDKFDHVMPTISSVQWDLLELARIKLTPAQAKEAMVFHSGGKAHAQIAARSLARLVKRGLLICHGRRKSKSGHWYKLSVLGAELMGGVEGRIQGKWGWWNQGRPSGVVNNNAESPDPPIQQDPQTNESERDKK